MHKYFYLFFSYIFVLNVNAQQETPISLNEVLAKIENNNYSVKIAEQDYKLAKADFNQSNSVYLPKISISHTGIITTNPLMAFGSKLNQEILAQYDFDPNLLNNPDEIKNFSTKIEVLQPLINVDGFFMRKAAKAKMNAMELTSKRTNDAMKLEVKKAYMQLQLTYKSVEVLEKAEKTAIENLKIAEDNFNQGYLQKVDVLSVEIYVNDVKNKLLSAKSDIKNASNYLQYLIGENENTILKPTSELIYKKDFDIHNASISNSRADIAAMETSTNAYKNLHSASKMSYLPKLNAFGSYELYDKNVFSGEANGYLIGAQLSWDVFDGYKRIGKTQKQKADYDKASINLEQYKHKSQLELSKTKENLLLVENSLILTNLAVEQSKEELRIRRNRYNQGLEKSSDLLNSETKYLQKQLENLKTIYNYNLTKEYLTFLSI